MPQVRMHNRKGSAGSLLAKLFIMNKMVGMVKKYMEPSAPRTLNKARTNNKFTAALDWRTFGKLSNELREESRRVTRSMWCIRALCVGSSMCASHNGNP